MRKSGVVYLPLHYGHAPKWLTVRMKALSDAMLKVMYREEGASGILEKLSSPLWFQSFGCVLGFDWHSSGLTTVVCGVLKDVLKVEEHGIKVAGGKGKSALKTQLEIEKIGGELSLPEHKLNALKYSSRMAAKVDTAAIQCNYPIYHHTLFISEKGEWCIIQQGLNVEHKLARRYHWLSKQLASFVCTPHSGIAAPKLETRVLDMTAKESEESRRVAVDLVKGSPENLISSIRLLSGQHTLDQWFSIEKPSTPTPIFKMPRRLDWNLFKKLYDIQPKNYEELLAVQGVGPAVVRALALVSQLIYGSPPSWKDPAKFTFAHGGKDGVPYPVDRRTMDKTISKLRGYLESSEAEREQIRGALKRLESLSHAWGL
ncbi:MAG: DUF763 domain-containing protein [Nitrososphaerales archaeon]